MVPATQSFTVFVTSKLAVWPFATDAVAMFVDPGFVFHVTDPGDQFPSTRSNHTLVAVDE
ncbi:hypothetical protein MUB16_36080 [Priestia sp. OVL9]|nr:hypothetical protein [Priestia sp. OVL9]